MYVYRPYVFWFPTICLESRDPAFITSFAVLYYFDSRKATSRGVYSTTARVMEQAASCIPAWVTLPLPCCEAASLHVIPAEVWGSAASSPSGSGGAPQVGSGGARPPNNFCVKMCIIFSAALLLLKCLQRWCYAIFFKVNILHWFVIFSVWHSIQVTMIKCFMILYFLYQQLMPQFISNHCFWRTEWCSQL